MVEEAFNNHWLGRRDEYKTVGRIEFGAGIISHIGEFANSVAKNKDTLLVSDVQLQSVGLLDKVKTPLEAAGFNVDLCLSEAKEPMIDDVKQVIKKAASKDYGIVIGFGGGSAMDRAKIGACLSETSEDLNNFLCPSTKPLPRSKPKILIPTTAGTGSEVSNTAVVIVAHETMKSVKTWVTGDSILADIAVIDPSLTLGLPPKATAGSGVDALSHTAEGVLSLQANPISDALGLKAIELISKNLRTAYHQGNNIEARWNMSLAAMLGGVVISFPWVSGPACLGHVVSEGISSRYNVPHGEACGVVLPYVYWYNLPDDYAKEKMAMIAHAMGCEVKGLSAKNAAKEAIKATFELLEDIDLPTSLKEEGVPKEDIPLLVKYTLERSEVMYSMSKFNPRKATEKNLSEFFLRAWEGKDSLKL